MKPKTVLRTLAGLTALIFSTPARAEFPVIQSIQVEATNLVVTARVPAGPVRVVLESRERLLSGAWTPVAVQRGDGAGGTITFRLPRTAEFACFRVRTDAAEPLPASFYSGTSIFDPQPLSSGPGLGFWPIYTSGFSFDAELSIFGTIQSTALSGLSSAPGGTSVAPREVVESDIWRLAGDTLYFFNQNRGLQIIDVRDPDAAKLLGTLNLPAVGEQMYLLSPNHVVLLTRPACGGGEPGAVLVVALSKREPRIVARLAVTGAITESRLVGTALYVASQAARPAPPGTGDTWERGTQIASFDLGVPDAPVARSTLWFSGGNVVVHATDACLFAITQHSANGWQSTLNIIDITAPDGTMNPRDSTTVAGRVADKFKLNWSGDVLSVISEVAANPLVTKLETFRLPAPRSQVPSALDEGVRRGRGRHSLEERASSPRRSPPSFVRSKGRSTSENLTEADLGTNQCVKLGEVELGHGERLFATRFDGPRAYVVTFRQIDPLWVVDLSDPTHPAVSGELQVPGWSTYIHPMGNRLLAVGTEAGRTTVSLFDVSDPSRPALSSRVQLGSSYSSSEANSDEKAFTVLEDAGLILLPVEGYTTNGYRSWVQLIDLGTNSLTARGQIEHAVTPRRATLHRDRIVSFSAAELLSVNATDRDAPRLAGRLELSWPINRVFLAGDYLIEITTGNDWDTQVTPVVRVAPARDPGRVLSALAFSNAPIVGATVRSNRLYLVQASNGYGVQWVGNGTQQSLPPTLWLSIVDLSSLPGLSVLGQAGAATSPLGWNSELEPVWPKPDLLVWRVAGDGYPWTLWDGPRATVLVGGLASFNSFWPYPVSSGGGRLLAFDVSNPTAPALLSDVNLATNGGWSFSQPFATDGLVYLSHQAYAELEPTATTSLTNVVLFGWWPPRFQRSFLDVVDYADARHPTVRPPVNIPGALHGLSHGGELLYTVGFHRTSTNWNEGAQALDASAYDGVSAHLVDSLSLSNVSPHPILVSGTNIFLGRAPASATANVVAPTLETWTLSGTGDFTMLGSVTLPGAASELVSFHGLLAARVDGNRVVVFGDSNLAALRLVGEGPATGCLDFNLRHAAAARARDLWLPMDAYGVTGIKLSP